MASGESHLRELFDELKPGDRIEVEHTLTVGRKSRTTKTTGLVVRTEHCRHRPHFQRNHNDKGFGDVILLELPDGELTTVTMDESTVLRRA
jgi:ribosomal protein L19